LFSARNFENCEKPLASVAEEDASPLLFQESTENLR